MSQTQITYELASPFDFLTWINVSLEDHQDIIIGLEGGSASSMRTKN